MATMTQAIAGFLAGDQEAVRDVYREYGGPVQTIARSMLSDPEAVKDAIQQTFLKAWRSRATFDQDKPFAPWLYAIARRTAIDALRKQGREPDATIVLPDDVAADDSNSAPMTFERTWEVFEVRRALDQLPQVEAAVVRLSHLDGLSHPEIAERLGIPIGTVKSRSARAHARLAQVLAHLRASPAPPRITANHQDAIDVQDRKE